MIRLMILSLFMKKILCKQIYCLYLLQKKLTILSRVVNTTDTHAIKCEPVTPTFLPKNPEIIELNKGNIIMVKYII